jgi:hypothetical protein
MWWSDHHAVEVSPVRPKQNHCRAQWFFCEDFKSSDGKANEEVASSGSVSPLL